MVSNFIDPLTGAHTQGIERVWWDWKQYVREMRCIHQEDIEEHLYSWLFRYNRVQSGVTREQIIDDIFTCWS